MLVIQRDLGLHHGEFRPSAFNFIDPNSPLARCCENFKSTPANNPNINLPFIFSSHQKVYDQQHSKMESLSHNVPASSLNNSAIMYLQAGKSHEAMELLQIALSKLRDQFMDCEESDWESQCDDDEPTGCTHDDPVTKCDQESTEAPTKALSVFSL